MHKLNKDRKHALVLIEVLIALLLLSLMASFLFIGYRQISDHTQIYQEATRREEKIANAQQTLTRVFSQVVLDQDNKLYSCFYTPSEQGQLIFTFDNGIDKDPLFSSQILGKLYVDEVHRLCLTMWPLPGRWNSQPPMVRREILLDHVDSLAFSFYYPPPPHPLEINPGPIIQGLEHPEPQMGMQTKWLLAYRKLPAIIKLNIRYQESDDDIPIHFSFLLPGSQKTIKIKQDRI